MDGPHSIRPKRPRGRLGHGGVDPLRQIRNTLQRGPDGLSGGVGGQPCGKRVDGLDQIIGADLAGLGDQVRMHDLDFRAEPLRLARHDALFAGRQSAHQIVLAGVKEHQMEETALIARAHLVGLLQGRAGHMRLDHHVQRDKARRAALTTLGNRHAPRAVDNP